MARGSDQPNVVVCLCDQLRAFEVGCYRNSVVRTPSIDRLAENGVRFEIACSNNPVCTPARSVLLGGQYSRSGTGSLVNCHEPRPRRVRLVDPTLAEAFKAAGYRTGLIGKWHIDPDPLAVGFDSVFYPYVSHRYTGQTYIHTSGKKTLAPGFTTDFELEALGSYVREHRDGPFFLFHNISQPHMPVLDAPERYRTMYSPDEVPLRGNVWQDGKPACDENWFRIYAWDFLYYQHHLPYTETLPEGFDLRRLTAHYYGMTTWADDQLGELMRLLEENGIAGNTIVVFTSDHGDNLGSHQLFNKDQLYEESIRIPMIVHWPAGLAARSVDGQVASLVDVMPTALSLGGVPTPASAQGTDLSSVCRGEAPVAGENAAYIETSPGEIGIRTLTHLYGIRKAKDGRGRTGSIIDDEHKFFDLRDDPLEENNLAKTGQSADVARELRERLTRWDRETPWLEAPE